VFSTLRGPPRTFRPDRDSR